MIVAWKRWLLASGVAISAGMTTRTEKVPVAEVEACVA